eukprot:GHVS01048016.1.p1 GENE.GHVS01048016.1~~GHVS01048016.1.p1  ORF type:complete len:374 (+),score=86.96 GHVS01048016.1:66-1124(+)
MGGVLFSYRWTLTSPLLLLFFLAASVTHISFSPSSPSPSPSPSSPSSPSPSSSSTTLLSSSTFPLLLLLHSPPPPPPPAPSRRLVGPHPTAAAAAADGGAAATQSCALLEGFGILIQLALAFLCFSMLVLKRQRERPRRSWSVFLLDSSKQLTGAFTIHILNLVFASLLSEHHGGDECNWYWINIVVDCTLGVFFLYLYFNRVKRILHLEGSNEFGYYGDPPRGGIWIRQMLIWQFIVCAMKLTMVVVMLIAHTPLEIIAGAALSPLTNFPKGKLVVVMVLTPFVMNTFQLWITDSFIKKQELPRTPSSPTSVTVGVTVLGSGSRNLGLMIDSLEATTDGGSDTEEDKTIFI